MSVSDKILIKTKKQVLSEIVGNNSSLFKGEGYNFSEIREYQIGDDIRKIDWIISAKLQKPYVKEFLEERELNISTISMLSGSMYFGSHKLKQEVLAEVVSIVSFSASLNGDKFSSYIYAPNYHSHTKPSRKSVYLKKTINDILSINPLGNSINIKEIQDDIHKRVKKKSILFFIGDFVTDDLNLHLLSKKHEVIALIIRDRLEENPKNLGLINSIDANTQKQSNILIDDSLAKQYSKAMYENDHKLYEYFRKYKIKFTKIYTDIEPIIPLKKMFL
jgi:uncharacterized protein (DUF58 family)